ncbi:E3 ubiquitin-protein ligase MARCH2 [Aphelenchoides avenae]|nr:E3 ubiquitin-protein ligase MARCH2 [Aphelenchus avenae]
MPMNFKKLTVAFRNRGDGNVYMDGPTSPPAGGAAVCRICHSSEKSGPTDGEPLISPCRCKGTMGLFHRTCLNRWLRQCKKDHCEICKFKFEVVSVRPSFSEFVRGKDDAKLDRNNMLTDIFIFTIITPLAFISSYMCGQSAMETRREIDAARAAARASYAPMPKRDVDEMSVGGLWFLSGLIIFTWIGWLLICINYHRICFREWQQRNQKPQIADQLTHDESRVLNGKQRPGRVTTCANSLRSLFKCLCCVAADDNQSHSTTVVPQGPAVDNVSRINFDMNATIANHSPLANSTVVASEDDGGQHALNTTTTSGTAESLPMIAGSRGNNIFSTHSAFRPVHNYDEPPDVDFPAMNSYDSHPAVNLASPLRTTLPRPFVQTSPVVRNNARRVHFNELSPVKEPRDSIYV